LKKPKESKKIITDFGDLDKLMDEEGETFSTKEFEEQYEDDLSYINAEEILEKEGFEPVSKEEQKRRILRFTRSIS